MINLKEEKDRNMKEKSKLKSKTIRIKELKKSSKGITLIALVITIIVLLILAGVSIAMLTGENGILNQANKAKIETDYKGAEEKIKLAVMGARADDGQMTIEELKREVELQEGSTTSTTFPAEVQMDGYTFTVDNTGTVTGNGSGGATDGNIDPETGWDLDKVAKVKSDDNIIVPVPIGYVKSTAKEEGSVSTGFVIKEGKDGAATEGINEFVWVPVPEISDIYDEEHQAGQLWSFNGTTSTKKAYPITGNSEFHEPDVATGKGGNDYDADSNNLQEAGFDRDLNSDEKVNADDFKIQLQKDFNSMIKSVRIYKGFYIGRYETGNLSSTTEAVVQKNNSDIHSQTWYTMYKVSKTIGAKANVTSSMIWGCQWDATLRWMQTSDDEEVKNFPTNAKGKGNWSFLEIPTGSVPAYAVNNIYDMAGNVWELTLEARWW